MTLAETPHPASDSINGANNRPVPSSPGSRISSRRGIPAFTRKDHNSFWVMAFSTACVRSRQSSFSRISDM